MPSFYFAVTAAVLAGFSHLAQAQTNITESACADGSNFSSCNRKVADKWSSCVKDCNGNGNCIVDCGCTGHQEYINCMAQSCWNQVYSCEYQLFVQQYFAVCPHAVEPIPFWPAPDNAPNRCSCDLGKVTQNTLASRKSQLSCMKNVTDHPVRDIPDLSNLGHGLDIAKQASECACCGASASISAYSSLTYRSAWEVCPHTIPHLAGADLWPVFFPHDIPNLYHSLPNWAWGSCDGTLGDADCKRLGFDDADKFYKPGDYPNNGTSKLHNVGGTLTVPPSGTVLTWSQSSTTWTVTATGYDKKAVASQSDYRATATDPDSFPEQTADSGAAGVKPVSMAALLGVVGVLMAL
ncbi:hypothetical protein N7492_003642 [Penicillium capsulatum]|uniref:Extracellular membrane protein CFEM domain-containing protein n=1 Tax=Penicillium capsulatum TaxID=69766 RepID=A0A9W9IMH4_9EURO|nr:hypothetical protein N7492_003642 [Penicillium capsulatum]KAJ6121777.1 hypothetical protein N7512_004242 [Penicillium capsulatum]